MGCDVDFVADINISGKYYEHLYQLGDDIQELEEDIQRTKDRLKLMISIDIEKQTPAEYDGDVIRYISETTEYLFEELERDIRLLTKLYILLNAVKAGKVDLKKSSSC